MYDPRRLRLIFVVLVLMSVFLSGFPDKILAASSACYEDEYDCGCDQTCH